MSKQDLRDVLNIENHDVEFYITNYSVLGYQLFKFIGLSKLRTRKYSYYPFYPMWLKSYQKINVCGVNTTVMLDILLFVYNILIISHDSMIGIFHCLPPTVVVLTVGDIMTKYAALFSEHLYVLPQ